MTATSTDGELALDSAEAAAAAPPATSDRDAPATTTSTALVPLDAPARTQPPPPVPGAGLIAEAELAIEERRWRDALRVLDAVESIGATSVHTDGLLALAATHLNKARVAGEAVGRIRASTQTADTHRALAAVSVARHEYLTADRELRAGLDLLADDDLEPDTADWAQFASIYGGLGWFDEAAECLDHAESSGADEKERWAVGRSINHWAMTRTWALPIGAVLFYFIGLLALAVAITVPFVMRELRVAQLDDRMASLAADAWLHERWLRVAHAAGVLATVVLWSFAVQL